MHSICTIFAVYKDEKLFDCTPGRSHRTFQGFEDKYEIRDPSKFKARLAGYAVDLDSEYHAFNLPDE